ncbi:tyrosine-type recombinase/integrase [Rhodanobacter sp. C03]|uniref:tyrosine-type recombinase/integrase n=1 Tax=Rhodanobacter sp. C03 TaxID=1945858 RepID=UPI000987994D|nr:tyrosine-type recombinase/integrase [Rhodanobacter sp. C03]OOG57880.1 integrase [Rhodanobacter sp. C03]
MALTDTKLQRLQPKERSFQVADGNGLYVEVQPTGKKVWRMQYRIGGRDGKKEKITLGEYPAYSLVEARRWRDECRAKIVRGQSPARAKQAEKTAAAEAEKDTVRAFAEAWFADVVNRTNSEPRNIRRILNKDVLPAIGDKPVAEVRVEDVLKVTDAIKARGADHMALHTRNAMKRLFAYAIARGKIQFNPAAAVEARFIATARSRDVALSSQEIGRLLRGIYQSSAKRQYKLALHLLILCMVRKSELLEARWEELGFDKAEWNIPAERMKKDKPHLVPLSEQAVAMFQELRVLSSGSEWVLPSRGSLRQPIAKSTLNNVVRSLNLEVRDFVIHDFRRTASTHLHEAGFNSDWVEKALAHEQKGVRGVYNRAEYLSQRKEMLQWWSNFVDAQIEEGRNVVIGNFGRYLPAA